MGGERERGIDHAVTYTLIALTCLVSIQLTETAVAVDRDKNADSGAPRLAINALSLFAPEAIEEVAATRQALYLQPMQKTTRIGCKPSV